MAFALDIAVIVIITATAIIGFCRGFARYAIKMLGTLVCVVLALIVSDLVAESVYDGFVEPRLQSKIKENLKNFDVNDAVRECLNSYGYDIAISDEQLNQALTDSGSISGAVSNIAKQGGMPQEQSDQLSDCVDEYFSKEFFSDVCEKAGIENSDLISDNMEMSQGVIYDMVRAFANDDLDSGSDYITGTMFKDFFTSIVRCVLFVIILIVAESILSIIFAISGVFDIIPVANGINRFLGLLLGMVKGCLYIALIAFIASFIIKSGANELGTMQLSTDVIDKTFIFRYIFYIFY